MKYSFLLFISLIAAFSINAQTSKYPVSRNKVSGNAFKTDSFNFKSNNLDIYSAGVNQLQYHEYFVLKLPQPKLTYIQNFKGFDLYKAIPDNMFVIKPDSSIVFTMPVKKIEKHDN